MSASVSRRSFLGLAGGTAALLGLAACGGNKADGKSYIVATDTTFAPFEFTDENGDFVGIDLDLLAAIAADQGFKYELNPLGFDAAVAALESNQADAVIAGMSITPKREEDYDFSDPYYDSYVCAAVAEDSDVQDLEGLHGATVACKNGTQSLAWAESIAEEYGFEMRRVLTGFKHVGGQIDQLLKRQFRPEFLCRPYQNRIRPNKGAWRDSHSMHRQGPMHRTLLPSL